MKISLLSHDLSQNCLGRAYLLAKLLQSKHKVEIIGPLLLGREIWFPVSDDKTIQYKIIRQTLDFPGILKLIDGDIIYAVKPRFTSFGYGLIKKFISKKKLILDIDDWELGFFLDDPFLNKVRSIISFGDLNNLFYSAILENFIKFADAITVSSTFLSKKYQGIIIPHARDTNIFDPKKYDRVKLRAKHQLRDKKVILFLGTPRQHKGIEDLHKAVKILDDKRAVLLVVDQQPFTKIPQFLVIADVVVIPQRQTYATRAQIPAKVFDAMAMAKPIVATDVSDLPKILRGCAVIVPPSDPVEIAKAIRFIFDNPDIAERLGERARRICIQKYNFNVVGKKLLEVVELV